MKVLRAVRDAGKMTYGEALARRRNGEELELRRKANIVYIYVNKEKSNQLAQGLQETV